MPEFSIIPYLELGGLFVTMGIVHLTLGLMTGVRFFFFAAAFMVACLAAPVGFYLSTSAEVAWADTLDQDTAHRPMGSAELKRLGDDVVSGVVYGKSEDGKRLYCVEYFDH